MWHLHLFEKMDFHFAPTNINTVINYVKSALSEVAKTKGLNLVTEEYQKIPDITADSRRLEQVLTNLVSNAIKFTPEGKTITISSRLVNADDIKVNEYFKDSIKNLSGEYVEVCVKDEGIGIESKNLLHAFDKFAQIENSLSRKAGGTGLGLPIAKQLLDAHKGAIWCDSIVNKGSQFYFVIPIATSKSKFLLTKKQLMQKAREKNSTLLSINMKASKDVMTNLLKEEDIFNDAYLNNSLIEDNNDETALSLMIVDGNKTFAEFLQRRIKDVMADKSEKYKNCDIMYSYKVEGVSDEKNSYSR